jgi:hypothetical protein
VVDRRRMDALPNIPGNGDKPSLTAWVDVVEHGPEAPTSTEWKNTDSLVVRAPVKEGQSVFVQVSFDANWRAYVEGKRVAIRRNKLGFMTIDAPPGTEEVHLEFPTPFPNLVGRVITAGSMLIVGLLLFRGRLCGRFEGSNPSRVAKRGMARFIDAHRSPCVLRDRRIWNIQVRQSRTFGSVSAETCIGALTMLWKNRA